MKESSENFSLSSTTPNDNNTSAGDLGVIETDNESQIEWRVAIRVLVLTSSPPADAPATSATATSATATSATGRARWSAALAEAGHETSWTERDNWKPDAMEPCGDRAPEVLLIDATTDATSDAASDAQGMDAVVALCRQIKSSEAAFCTALLVALPAPVSSVDATSHDATSQSASSQDTAALISRLQEAGADDFLISETDAELMVRVVSMARLARLRGQLQATRAHLQLHLQLDDLTRLLNRRFFFQAAHREYARALRYNHDLSCLMLEVNGFKRFNVSFGYECGDAVLRQIAGVLRTVTRECDIVARFGEEKFVLLLPETPLEGAITLRENIGRAIAEQPFLWREQRLPLSASIGEAARSLTRSAQAPAEIEFGADFINSDEPEVVPLSLREEMAGLLEEADAALYVAKRGVRYQALPGAPTDKIRRPADAPAAQILTSRDDNS